MKKSRLWGPLAALIFCPALLPGSLGLKAQSTGYYDNFEDGVADTFWKADHERTFGISEAEGSLNIVYTRTAESQAWDNFNFTPPEEIDVSGNPEIIFRLRSDVSTEFTVKPIYTNGEDGWIKKQVPSDNLWHTYTFELEENNYQGGLLRKIYFYFDGGSTALKSGTISFDEFQVAGLSVDITNLKASVLDSVTIRLDWSSSDPGRVKYFNVYRGDSASFSPGSANLLVQPVDTFMLDSGLREHSTYYYRVSATDTSDREHPTTPISIRTHTPGAPPSPVFLSENANPVGRYEKYEMEVILNDAEFGNPYNPDEIDLWAIFTGTGGQSQRINGFYDDYEGRGSWKIRFAADQTGTWTCLVKAKDRDGQGQALVHSFQVVDSGNRGHIHISSTNADYLVYDDQHTFYGVAVYYPWWVTEEGLDKLAGSGCNMFGYWDCTFDGAGNEGGRHLLESKKSGLGRMDQDKAARIDQVLEWSEARDLKVMLALWAHPYLRISGEPWNDGLWFSKNPYSDTFDIEEFYTDSLALSYQEKHHRYAIARFGYSTSLAIWEIINEMHGTTGWVRNQSGAKSWVEDVHHYLKENDPYQRPTTASFGGSKGASHHFDGDQLGDMPNVHFYEIYGWPKPFPGNLVRSGLTNVVTEAEKLKSKGRRPAFLGEAGYTSMLTNHTTEEYTWELHNALWAGLSNGLASTPFWWDYTSTDEVLTDERMAHYKVFGKFAEELHFPQLMEQAELSMTGTDAYFRSGANTGVGWAYAYGDTAVSNAKLVVSESLLKNGTYELSWYDTWTGSSPGEEWTYCVEGISWTSVPASADKNDVAFSLKRMEEGWGPASQLQLRDVWIDTTVSGRDTSICKIICYVTDEQGMLDAGYNGEVDILTEGASAPASGKYPLTEGGAVLEYVNSDSSMASITATIDGIGRASLSFAGIVGSGQDGPPTIGSNTLSPVHPNPLNGSCNIKYTLERSRQISLTVYDARGRLVEVLEEGLNQSGVSMIDWSADHLSAGLYFLSLTGSDFRLTQKFMVE